MGVLCVLIMNTAIIQINALSGMGDILCDIYHSILISQTLKKHSYNVSLIFYWAGHDTSFKKIFDDSFLNYFDSVEETSTQIRDKQFRNNNHIGFCGERPGIHHIDVLTNTDSNPIDMNWFNTTQVSATRFAQYGHKHEYEVEFSKQVLDKQNFALSKLNDDHVFLHVRRKDKLNTETLESGLLNFIDTNLSHENIHLGSDDIELAKNISSQRPNIYTYDFGEFDDYNCNIQAIKFDDILASMLTVQYAQKLYCYNDYSWTSNFLYHGLTHGNNKELLTVRLQ